MLPFCGNILLNMTCLPSDRNVFTLIPSLNGPTPSTVMAATRNVYSVPHLRFKNVTDFKRVSSETIPKRDVISYEYRSVSPPRSSHVKSSQDILNDLAATSDAITSVGGPVGTVTQFVHALEFIFRTVMFILFCNCILYRAYASLIGRFWLQPQVIIIQIWHPPCVGLILHLTTQLF